MNRNSSQGDVFALSDAPADTADVRLDPSAVEEGKARLIDSTKFAGNKPMFKSAVSGNT